MSRLFCLFSTQHSANWQFNNKARFSLRISLAPKRKRCNTWYLYDNLLRRRNIRQALRCIAVILRVGPIQTDQVKVYRDVTIYIQRPTNILNHFLFLRGLKRIFPLKTPRRVLSLYFPSRPSYT